MKNYSSLKSPFTILTLFILVTLLNSCGIHAPYLDTDGVYNNAKAEIPKTYEYEQYYTDYFSEKNEEVAQYDEFGNEIIDDWNDPYYNNSMGFWANNWWWNSFLWNDFYWGWNYGMGWNYGLGFFGFNYFPYYGYPFFWDNTRYSVANTNRTISNNRTWNGQNSEISYRNFSSSRRITPHINNSYTNINNNTRKSFTNAETARLAVRNQVINQREVNQDNRIYSRENGVTRSTSTISTSRGSSGTISSGSRSIGTSVGRR